MSPTPRVEIEARFFILTYVGKKKQSGQLPDQERLREDLLRVFPLERWHEQGAITKQQVTEWIAQALALLTSQGEPEAE